MPFLLLFFYFISQTDNGQINDNLEIHFCARYLVISSFGSAKTKRSKRYVLRSLSSVNEQTVLTSTRQSLL